VGTVHRRIRLQSSEGFRHGASAGLCAAVMARLDEVSRRAVRMAFAGTSSAPGRPRPWLQAATDLRLVDFAPGDEAILHYELATFGEAAPELYRQQELWATVPDPKWTAFDTLSWVLEDTNRGSVDSDRYDRGLLLKLSGFSRALSAELSRVEIEDRRGDHSESATIDAGTVQRARHLSHATPSTRLVRVSGRLDMLRVSTQTLGLKLASGDEVRGVLVEGEMESLQSLLDKDVILQGRAVYRPSGSLLRIDTNLVVASADETGVFARVPGPLDRRTVGERRSQGPNAGLAAAFGKWPGEESDDELLRALSDLS
jgi:hypothetical protein